MAKDSSGTAEAELGARPRLQQFGFGRKALPSQLASQTAVAAYEERADCCLITRQYERPRVSEKLRGAQ